ncbi:MAG: heparinase II/III-family protein [Bacteroidales bacterium]|nr:heparinase II/III-family protein [Bacteroidales bacterium]
MQRAETIGLSASPIEYRFDASGRRLLHRSRDALQRISLCAYAYNVTGEDKYLNHAIADLSTVCSFPSWNAENHFLDAGEMSLAVAIGYDWLYDNIPSELKQTIVRTIDKYAFKPAADPDVAWFYYSEGNWNQVCNAGLVAGALATYEACDTVAQRIISDAVSTNRRIMEKVYSPYGCYSEGPGYWLYGNMFQVILLSELESALGTDFNLSEIEGFDKTSLYKQFTYRPTGKSFNYSDNHDKLTPSYPLWYFADRFTNPSLLDSELLQLYSGSYTSPEEVRVLPILMRYALHLKKSNTNADRGHIYSSDGDTPIVMVRGNWKSNKKDFYLGIKGGSPTGSHTHMDGGSFVYDAFGKTWAMDMGRQEYADLELICNAKGGDFWSVASESLRWRFLKMNNRGHNTITINDKDFLVKGKAELVETIDDGDCWGGVMDLSSLYGDQVKSAIRRLVISKDGTLTVVDTIEAGGSVDANIRWSFVTPATPTVSHDRIVLNNDGVKMSLKTDSNASVTYEMFSSDPSDYHWVVSDEEAKNPGISICGFTARVEKGKTAVFKTVLKKL